MGLKKFKKERSKNSKKMHKEEKELSFTSAVGSAAGEDIVGSLRKLW